jgi:hypothetical protein
MASKEEREHEDQHVGHVAFRIPDFWPHNPSTWFRKIESKFRICNIRQSSTKYDHLLSALPTDICSSINDSLVEIDENAEDAYEQLKALLMSRYTMDRWARSFKLHKFPEIGDMKPSEMMRQMKALLPPDSNAGTYKDDSDICYYHTTYGEQAIKCKPGCQWVPGNGSAAGN